MDRAVVASGLEGEEVGVDDAAALLAVAFKEKVGVTPMAENAFKLSRFQICK